MGMLTVNTANCMCSFGAAPAPLLATSVPNVTALNQPAATIMDLPKLPFGMCSSLANPAVAAATVAAKGGTYTNAVYTAGSPLGTGLTNCVDRRYPCT